MTTELDRKIFHHYGSGGGYARIGHLIRVEEDGKPANGIHFHTRLPLTPKEAVIFLRTEKIINGNEKVLAVTDCGTDSNGKQGYAVRTDGMNGPEGYPSPKRLQKLTALANRITLGAFQVVRQKFVPGK